MSGLTQRNQAGQSGLVAPKVDFQRFDTAGSTTWTKPGDVSIVWIECIGAGGAGGGGGTGNSGGGGGGGGAYAWACFYADALPATLDVVVGAGGTVSGTFVDGGTGGDSEVHLTSSYTSLGSIADGAGKILLKAWGGGGGSKSLSAGGGGGGGGGTGGAGARGEVRIWAF